MIEYDTIEEHEQSYEYSSVFNLTGPVLQYHVVLHSYTLQDIIDGTILDTKTDLGYFSDTSSIDISEIILALQKYTIPDNMPDWKVEMINNMLEHPVMPQFNLVIELVGINGN